MCSIIVSNIPKNNLLQKANRFIKKRGPDHTSWGSANGLTFVHNLLSITGDFTPQPFLDKENEIVCLYNGEIYNFREIIENFPNF